MSLYRKYRPQNFADVIGQEKVVEVLEAIIKTDKIAHAYLFAGSRGTGKTSIARIFARAIGTAPSDLYEIDAASNRGIDEVRELREAVRTLPFESKYKVYIIDEVHMLTPPAFNALLKTLEEPPPHVVFILATTEKHKLPETIISRCQTYIFNRPSEVQVEQLLAHVIKEEGYKAEQGSLNFISMLSEGSFRDALTILEKCVAISKNKVVELSEVEHVSGAPSSAITGELLQMLVLSDSKKALQIIQKATESNFDMKVFNKLLLRAARLSMLMLFAPDLKVKIKSELGEKEYMALEALSSSESAKKLLNILRALLRAYNELGSAHVPSLPLELAVIELCQ